MTTTKTERKNNTTGTKAVMWGLTFLGIILVFACAVLLVAIDYLTYDFSKQAVEAWLTHHAAPAQLAIIVMVVFYAVDALAVCLMYRKTTARPEMRVWIFLIWLVISSVNAICTGIGVNGILGALLGIVDTIVIWFFRTFFVLVVSVNIKESSGIKDTAQMTREIDHINRMM